MKTKHFFWNCRPNDLRGEGEVIAQALEEFEAPPGALDDAEVYFANYEWEDYGGYAAVIFERDGKLWHVNGGHCSCHGLEDQWEPQETTWETIAMYPSKGVCGVQGDFARAMLAYRKTAAGGGQ